ncbi:MAG: NAD-dependent epimerase/dehydratase family protein, partial [Candidatus Pacebacteria bacterium]|nr:NAD-dependent epimerase/dehydratase family protein [Candidatus Paceibacterota bacterium]
MKKVLITGTSGFIGFHLAKRMLSEGWAVVGIDCITDYYDVRMKYARKQILEKSSKFKFYKLNIVNYDKLKEVFENEKPDLIVHLAAQAGVRYSLINPWAYAESNYIGTLNIFEAARTFGIKKVLYASSSSVYGANKEMPFSEDQKVDMPMSMYAVSKRANELLAYSYHNLSGMDAIGLRFFTVYGEYGRPDLALFKFTKNIIQGKEIMLFNNGEMTRNFTYVSDILDGILGIINKNIKGYKIYNLGGPDSTSLKKFVHLIEKNLGIKAKIKLMPIQSGDVPATIADTSKANRDFGFNPKIKIEDGVKIFIDWFLKNQDWLVGLEEEKITEFSSSVTRKLFEDNSSIAVFSLAYFPFEGGAEIALREFIKRMPFGFKIFTNRFDSKWDHEEENSGATVFRVGNGKSGNYYGRNFEKILYVFRAWRKAEKEHTKRPFDAIWGMMASYGGFAALLFKLRHPKIPFILTLQEGDSEAHILRRVGIFYIL